jgi:hypothetical protein
LGSHHIWETQPPCFVFPTHKIAPFLLLNLALQFGYFLLIATASLIFVAQAGVGSNADAIVRIKAAAANLAAIGNMVNLPL